MAFKHHQSYHALLPESTVATARIFPEGLLAEHPLYFLLALDGGFILEGKSITEGPASRNDEAIGRGLDRV